MLSTISKSSMPPSHSIPVGISSSGNRPRLPAQSKMKHTANTGTRNPNKSTLGHIVPLSTPGSPGHVYSNVRCEPTCAAILNTTASWPKFAATGNTTANSSVRDRAGNSRKKPARRPELFVRNAAGRIYPSVPSSSCMSIADDNSIENRTEAYFALAHDLANPCLAALTGLSAETLAQWQILMLVTPLYVRARENRR